MAAVLRDLRELLEPISGAHRTKVSTRFDEAEAELAHEAPDKQEIASSLDQALRYAEKAGELTTKAEELAPKLAKAGAWLGKGWDLVQRFLPSGDSDASGVGLINGPDDGPSSI